jgi:pimeloyl-ACP methyl ester carboxylesterase
MTTAPIWMAESGKETGPIIVLIHGSMDRSAGLLRLSRRLAPRWRVVRYDRRGYGRSVPHAGPFAVAQQVDDLEQVLAGRPAVLFGHSYGGNVALAAAERHPDLIRACIVYETPLSWEPWWPGSTAGSQALADAGDLEGAAERFMQRLIGPERWSRLPASTKRARRAEGPTMVGELSSLRLAAPFSPAGVGCPVLALFGEHGAEHHQEATRFLAAQLSNARALPIAGARHFGPNTHADAVAAEIETFLIDSGLIDSGITGSGTIDSGIIE